MGKTCISFGSDSIITTKMLAGSMAGLILFAHGISALLSDAFPQVDAPVEKSVSQKEGH